MSGLIPYDLIPACPDCRRPLFDRWLMSAPSGCATCDEAITRHRCTGRPSREGMDPGESWECPDCGSTWTAIEEADTCGECGQDVWRKTWETVEGDRMATAPRFRPEPYTPFRNALQGIAGAAFSGPFRNEITLPAACYRTAGGIMVHVRSACRCPR